jgi:zinc protease
MMIPFAERRTGPLLLVMTALLLFGAPARSAETALEKVTTVEGITEYRLPNGLRVLLLPDDSRSVVTTNLTVFVGSRHEGYGETGMAHLLEHMLFKGTPTHPNVPKALRDHGANFNGTTWLDRTNYFETMPASEANLEFGIKLEADRMVNSYVKREDLLSEMTVVRNEFERGENDPERILSQRMTAAAYEWHNYGKSTIGNRSDIERVPIASLQAFYRKYYQPNNAMLIIAGKFDPKKALDLVVKYFGPLKRSAHELPNTYTEEPAQDGERNVTLRRVGDVGVVGVIYHIPAGPSPEYPAAAILEDCLTSAPGGRLYKALVEKKLAEAVSGDARANHDPGIIEILAKVKPANIPAARDALIETVENLAKNPITDEEVARSKTRFEKMDEKILEASDRFAIFLSEWAACGDWRLFFINRDRLKKVTAADVNAAAAKYLIASNRTLGIFEPTKKPVLASIPETPDVAALVKDYKGGASLAQGEAFEPTPENIDKRTQTGTLTGGVKTAFLPKKTRGEVVVVRLTLRFGNKESLAGKTTAVDVLGSLMQRGTAKHARKELQDELDKLGATLGLNSDLGVLTATLQVKKPNLPAALKLVEEVLRQPSFPADEFDVLIRETVARLEQGKSDPQMLAVNALRRGIAPYPKDDIRYTPTIAEDVDRYKAVTLEQVKELYTTQLGGTAGELVAVGDFDPAELKTAFDRILAGWKSEVEYKRIPRPAVPGVKGETQVIETPGKANAVFLAGESFAMTDADPDYPALEVGNYLLGAAPLASRLSNRVRGKEGLSYGVGSQVSATSLDKNGRFMIFAITNPINMKKVDTAVKEELEKFLKEGPTSVELSEGKKAYLEKAKVARGNDAMLALHLSNNLFLGRTFAFTAEQEKKIETLDPLNIREAFQKYITPEKLVIIQAGDFSKK